MLKEKKCKKEDPSDINYVIDLRGKKGRASSPTEQKTPLDLAFIHETFGASSVDRPAVSFRDYRARLEVGVGALPFENNQPRYSGRSVPDSTQPTTLYLMAHVHAYEHLRYLVYPEKRVCS